MKLTEYRDASIVELASALEAAVMSPTLDRAGEVVPALGAMRDGVRTLIRAASNSSGATYDIKDLADANRRLWERSEHCLKVLNLMYADVIPEAAAR